MRIGHGYDVHKFAIDRKLILGGIEIPHSKGLDGHSDADVLCHAISDALLGAMALGDIGKLFPDTDSNFKGANSLNLLCEVVNLIRQKGYDIGNIDSTIIAQKPKLLGYIQEMRNSIAKKINCNINDISIKATTEEHLGFTGREEGMACHAVCILVPKKVDNIIRQL